MKNNLILEVAGRVFRFASREQVWRPRLGADSPLLPFLSSRQDIDFDVRLSANRPDRGALAGGSVIVTKSLDCWLADDFRTADIGLLVSPDLFWEHYAAFIELLVRILLVSSRSAVPVHACGVKVDSEGFLFPGPSGCGKTTLAHLWDGRRGATVLSDERVWLRRDPQGRFWLYASPLRSRKSRLSRSGVPLRSVFFPRHAEETTAVPAKGVQALQKLLNESYMGVYAALERNPPIDFYIDLLHSVPCYDLGFVPNQSALDVITRTVADG